MPSKKIIFHWILVLGVLALLGTGFLKNKEEIPVAHAATAELHGWAWSVNSPTGGAGWISFNCAETAGLCATNNYKVTLDTSTGNLSGYAWSRAIGWIRFDPGGTYPTGGGTSGNDAKLEGSNLTGWARACTVFSSGCSGGLKGDSDRGGWDGWISLSGTGYGVTQSGSDLAGYAWGSTNLGWINFYSVTLVGLGTAPVITTIGSMHPLTIGFPHTHGGAFATDVDGDLACYTWSLTLVPSGSLTTITSNASGCTLSGGSASIPNPTFTPDKVGQYTLQLVVTDASSLSSVPVSVTETASDVGTFTLSHDPYAGLHPHVLRDLAIRFTLSSNSVLKVNPQDGFNLPVQFTVLSVEKDNTGNGKGDGVGLAGIDDGDGVDPTADKDALGNPLLNDFSYIFNGTVGATSPVISSGGFSNTKFQVRRQNVPDGRYVVYLQAQSQTPPPPPPNNAIDFKGVTSPGGATKGLDNNVFDFPNTDFTVDFWFKPVITPGEYQELVYKGGTSIFYPGWSVITLGTQIFLNTHDGVGVEKNVFSTRTLEANHLYHVVATRSGSTGEIWVLDKSNGETTHTVTSGTVYSNWNGNNWALTVGASHSGGLRAKGPIDEVRIWNKKRIPVEFDADYAQQIACNTANLVGYWMMDETSGSTLSDCTSTGENLTLQGDEGINWLRILSPFIVPPAPPSPIIKYDKIVLVIGSQTPGFQEK